MGHTRNKMFPFHPHPYGAHLEWERTLPRAKNMPLACFLNALSSPAFPFGSGGTPEGTRYTKVLPPSSRRQATVHWTVAFEFSSPFYLEYKNGVSRMGYTRNKTFPFHPHPYGVRLKWERTLPRAFKSHLCVLVESTPEGTRYTKVLPPSSRRQATVHRTIAFEFSSPFYLEYKNGVSPKGYTVFGTAKLTKSEPFSASARAASMSLSVMVSAPSLWLSVITNLSS